MLPLNGSLASAMDCGAIFNEKKGPRALFSSHLDFLNLGDFKQACGTHTAVNDIFVKSVRCYVRHEVLVEDVHSGQKYMKETRDILSR